MNISEERPAVKAILCERWGDGQTELGWGWNAMAGVARQSKRQGRS